MDFSQEQTTFLTQVHQGIYTAARQLTPLSRSLPGVEDAALRASCEQYCRFVLAMLSDMYENPEAYALPVGDMEALLNGRRIGALKQKEPARTERIRSHTYNAVPGYQLLLCRLGMAGVPEGDALRVSAEDMASIGKKANASNSPIPLDKRLSGLARVGIIWDGERFASARFPGMFPGMCALAKAAEKTSAFGYFAFQNCEFRNIAAPYKPTCQDYFAPLTNARREMAERIHALAIANKMNPQISTFWKTDYKHKSTQAMCIDTEGGNLCVRITETYHWDDPALINDRLLREPPEFQRYMLRHVWGCTACSSSHLGAFAVILGKRRRVCTGGGIGFRWTNPTEDDLPAICKCLALRCQIIQEVKEKGKKK